jgi:hypothetical protein
MQVVPSICSKLELITLSTTRSILQTFKDNLHYLREIGDFAAHTQKDKKTNEIINASPEEAEWTLTVIDSLFEYFIVAPEKDRIRREGVDEKAAKAGRKPIKPRNADKAAKSKADTKDENGV